MEVIVDGSIFQAQAAGGILRATQELLPRLCALDPDLWIKVYTIGRVKVPPPRGERMAWVRVPNAGWVLRPTRFFDRKITPRVQDRFNRLWSGKPKSARLFHPTYYSLPFDSAVGPFVITVYDMIYERFPEWFCRECDEEFRRIKRRCIERADMLLCISNTTADDLRALYPYAAGKIRVIHYGCHRHFESAPADGNDNVKGRKPFLLYVGQRWGYKNFGALVRAFSVWRKRFDVALVVVGPAWTPEESVLLRTHNIEQNVQWMGTVSDVRLRDLYAGAAAFIYPSLYEGFGFPLLEAMTANTPIVASRIPSTVEVAGDYPIYFEPSSDEDLVRALSEALEVPRRKERADIAREISNRYSWNRTAQLTLEAYHALATN
jgi:glycosyltransferase involved in cell wall biosynthesis